MNATKRKHGDTEGPKGKRLTKFDAQKNFFAHFTVSYLVSISILTNFLKFSYFLF
jgi:hypothetical protein